MIDSTDMSTLAEIEAAVDELLPQEQRRLLEHIARRLEQTEAEASGLSLYEQSKDLCGIVSSGIPDLATNKAHMAGFGRSRQ